MVSRSPVVALPHTHNGWVAGDAPANFVDRIVESTYHKFVALSRNCFSHLNIRSIDSSCGLVDWGSDSRLTGGVCQTVLCRPR